MITVIAQNRVNKYRIRYFHLEKGSEDHWWHMIGFDDTTYNLVDLGVYKFYKQAIDVFANMDYQDNDIMYYKTNNKIFQMPENIIDERECIFIYGSIY